MKLGRFEIGKNCNPYFIAEMSGNHNASLKRALEIVDAAAATGANALKIQTYTPDTMTLDLKEGDFFISDKNSLWHGKSLYELYGEAMTPWDWHDEIKKRCDFHNMDFFSTPFDLTAVDFLEKLDVPFYKIASFENTDIRLIKAVAKTGKPVIISTGMASVTEIAEAVEAVRSCGNNQIVLLKCTSAYPAQPKDANIMTMKALKEAFNVEVGLSDHTMGIGVAVASVALGATVIEKHFTLKRADGGVDSAFSMEPNEFKQMIDESIMARQAVGEIKFDSLSGETTSKKHRRSLYFSQDIRAGEAITDNNIKAIRPGHGLPTKFYDLVIGRKAKVDIKKGTPVTFDLI